ncbi:MAG: Na+/H+ antiporter NhaC [Salibacteraceae bacterium]
MQNSKITLFQAFLPILVLIPLLALNVYYYGDNSLGGANQFALFFSAAIGILVGIYNKIPYSAILKSIRDNIANTTSAIIILLLIGALSGTWLISGIIPSLIVYGLKILTPTIFLLATTIICAVVSVASGSSWSTIATVGIALLGIGNALGFSEAITAGAVISGAYFGDKMSPLSDTTNLAAAMAKTDLFTHIKYMSYTTIPSFGISTLLYLIIGFYYDTSEGQINVSDLTNAVEQSYYISPILFLVPAIVLLLIMKKMKPIPVLFIGTLLGGVFAIIFQPELISNLAPNGVSALQGSYMVVIDAMTTDIGIETGNTAVNDLLSSSGMAGMLNTVFLIVCAMTFGGVLESIGSLHKITSILVKNAHSVGGLISRTVGSCLFVNLTASDQYLAIVLPGKMFNEAYDEMNLAPENLSRTLEDSGTVTSVIIPWNTCGATQSSVLGVATIAYLPFCFFNILSPLMTIIFAYGQIKIRNKSDEPA